MDNAEDIYSFYDALAHDYDAMTDFENRFAREEPVFKGILNRYSVHTALDAGAGTGFHSLLLAKLGVKVAAVDVSQEMLDRLQENAKKMQLSVDTAVLDFLDLAGSYDAQFDAVFCLGNTLVHLLTDEELRETLSNFHSLLKPGGVLIIQILNYDRILKEKKRVQNIKKKGNTTFIRFYDYCNDRLYFNILKVTEDAGRIHHTINTVELRPLLKEELADCVERVGFTSIEHYGSLQFEPFDENGSSNLVTVARP